VFRLNATHCRARIMEYEIQKVSVRHMGLLRLSSSDGVDHFSMSSIVRRSSLCQRQLDHVVGLDDNVRCIRYTSQRKPGVLAC
jgi:hypothetical protein